MRNITRTNSKTHQVAQSVSTSFLAPVNVLETAAQKYPSDFKPPGLRAASYKKYKTGKSHRK